MTTENIHSNYHPCTEEQAAQLRAKSMDAICEIVAAQNLIEQTDIEEAWDALEAAKGILDLMQEQLESQRKQP